MKRMMKATVLLAAGDMRIENRPIPELGVDGVMMRVAYCGICPSDLKMRQGREGVKLPYVMGHEFTGWVSEMGPAVRGLSLGDQVVVNPSQPCYTDCPACVHGIDNKCVRHSGGGGGGGFAEFKVAGQAAVHRLRPGTDLAAASMAEPLACVLHGQRRARVGLGSLVVIMGAGPIGLMHMMTARAAGARVIISDPNPLRLAAAVERNADIGVNPTNRKLEEVVLEASGGWGADAVIVAVGNKEACEQALGLLCLHGTAVFFASSYPNVPISLDANRVHYQEINITGSSDYTDQEFVEALSLIESGTVDTKSLISDVLPLDRIAEGMALVASGDRLKVVIQVGSGARD